MMRRLLLTTALVSMSATAAFADGYTPMAKDFDIKLGGDLDFQAGFRSQKKSYTLDSASGNDSGSQQGITANNKNVGFDTTAELYLDARNTTAQGMTYGAHVGIETTTASNRNIDNKHANTSYLFMEHKDMGRLEAGSNADAANSMMVSGASVASATGGVAGDWWKYVVLSSKSSTGTELNRIPDASNFILTPEVSMDYINLLPGSSNVSTAGKAGLVPNTEKARKLTYYTPKFNGFQVGLSYAPDLSNKGSVASLPSVETANGGVSNAFSLGLGWDGKIQKDHMVKVAATGVFGDPKHVSGTVVKKHDTREMGVGAMYMFKEMLSVALGYTNYDKTGLLKPATTTTSLGAKKGFAYTGGIGLAMDKFTVSLTGMISEKNKNKATLYSLGADYKMAPGLMPYAEVTMFDLKQKRAQDATTGAISDISPSTDKTKNKGTAFILGTKVKF
jgi:outer membrane protein OmpU